MSCAHWLIHTYLQHVGNLSVFINSCNASISFSGSWSLRCICAASCCSFYLSICVFLRSASSNITRKQLFFCDTWSLHTISWCARSLSAWRKVIAIIRDRLQLNGDKLPLARWHVQLPWDWKWSSRGWRCWTFILWATSWSSRLLVITCETFTLVCLRLQDKSHIFSHCQ